MNGAAIDTALQDLWRAWGAGQIEDAEAARLATTLTERQRQASKEPLRPIGMPKIARRFNPRRYQPSPDRAASRQRRRTLGGHADMPDNVRWHYTEGERAVLTVIAGEVRKQGNCDLHVDAIAAKAGVSRSTVHNARREAVRLGHIIFRERRVPGDKSKTNVIHIVSGEWLTWLKRGPGCKFKISYSTTNQKIPRQIEPMPVERQHGIRLECG